MLSAVATLAARVREALSESATEMSEAEAAEIVSGVSLEAMQRVCPCQRADDGAQDSGGAGTNTSGPLRSSRRSVARTPGWP